MHNESCELINVDSFSVSTGQKGLIMLFSLPFQKIVRFPQKSIKREPALLINKGGLKYVSTAIV